MTTCDVPDLYSYDPVMRLWKRLTVPSDMTVNSASASFAIGNNIFFIWGTNSQGTSTNEVWSYNVLNDIWTRLDDFTGQARGVAMCMVISDMAYLGAGYLGPNNLGKDVYRFNAYALK